MLRADRAILPKGGHSGRWLVVGLFVVGAIVLAGFFLARAVLPPVPELPARDGHPSTAPSTIPAPSVGAG
jgi:hypothetical protein